MSIRKAKLYRYKTDSEGTEGDFSTDSGFSCYIGEPPWIDKDSNGKRDRGVSCIAEGDYMVKMEPSPTRKNKDGTPRVEYRLQNVPDADGVLIHSGTWFGDVTRGKKSDSKACLLPGRAIGRIAGQKAMLSSRDALQALVADLDGEEFLLSIRWDPKINPEKKA